MRLSAGVKKLGEIKKPKNFRKDEDAVLFNLDIEEGNNFRESAIVDSEKSSFTFKLCLSFCRLAI